MKKTVTNYPAFLLLAALCFLFSSCEKEAIKENNEGVSTMSNVLAKKDRLTLAKVRVSNEATFSRLLAKALKEDRSLREFIKKQSLKKFDKDFDVLYHLVKKDIISDSETFHDKIVKYADSTVDVVALEKQLPLLNIFVPKLPSGFSADSWNIDTEIPVVGVTTVENGKAYFYDGEGKRTDYDPSLIPGFPIIAVKENERVVVNNEANRAILSNQKQSNQSLQSEEFSYSFIDSNYDGSLQEEGQPEADTMITPRRAVTSTQVGSHNVTAYNSGVEWQRDNIYYGLTPTATTGPLRTTYTEKIMHFEFLNGQQGMDKITDRWDPIIDLRVPAWTEGYYEFNFIVYVNSKLGAGNAINLQVPVEPEEIWDITYNNQGNGWYTIGSVGTRSWVPNVPIIPWDIQNNGYAWKITVSEYDPGTTITRTENFKSTYASNFSVGIGKIGLNFGGSATTESSQNYQVSYSDGSDELGDCVVYFSDKVIDYDVNLPSFGRRYFTYLAQGGGWYLIGLEPQPK